MDELTTSIVGVDFPNEAKSKSKGRMECMLCAPGDLVELCLEPTNPFEENAVAAFSDRGTQLGYVSAERAPLIGKRMEEEDANAAFQAMHKNGAYISIRFGVGLPTLPDPIPDVPLREISRQMRPKQRPVTALIPSIRTTNMLRLGHNSCPYNFQRTFYPEEEGPEWDV